MASLTACVTEEPEKGGTAGTGHAALLNALGRYRSTEPRATKLSTVSPTLPKAGGRRKWGQPSLLPEVGDGSCGADGLGTAQL